MMLNQLLQKLDEKKERMIEIRRYLHQHPKLSFKGSRIKKVRILISWRRKMGRKLV
jgi:hypothetical protein